MEERNHSEKGRKDTTQGVFEWWNERSSISPGDSLYTKISKILIRLLGIIFLVAFSPLLLLALLVSFLVAL